MARETSVAVRVLAVVSLAVLGNLASCQVAFADRALPPTVACGAEGQFPDPTDCHYYLNCASDGGSGYTQTISRCPDGAYYDACNGNCSSTTPADQCIVACNANNSLLSSLQNPAIVFVCHSNPDGSYTITVSKCSTGLEQLGICSSNTKECPVNDAQVPGGCSEYGIGYHVDKNNCSIFYYCSSADATPDVGVCQTDMYFDVSSHSCVKFQCPSVGVFVDPLNCLQYYNCTKYGSEIIPQHIACPPGDHFDSSLGGCVTGSCTTVCPGAKFSCPSSGHFADPDSCTSYYFCDNNLQATHFSCPGRRHFDSVAGVCLMGSCSNRMV